MIHLSATYFPLPSNDIVFNYTQFTTGIHVYKKNHVDENMHVDHLSLYLSFNFIFQSSIFKCVEEATILSSVKRNEKNTHNPKNPRNVLTIFK